VGVLSAPIKPKLIASSKHPDFRVLVVDSDPVQLTALETSLKSLGYQVSTFTSIYDAITVLRSPIDLVLIDQPPPLLSAFLLAARPHFPHVPFLAMSADDTYHAVFRYLSQGADDYLIKPLSTELLRTLFVKILLKTRALRAIADRLDRIRQNGGISRSFVDEFTSVSQLLRGRSDVQLQIGYSRRTAISGLVVPFLSRLSLGDRLADIKFDIGTIGDDKLPNLIHEVIQKTSIPIEFARMQGEVEYFVKLTRDGYRSKPIQVFRAAVCCFRTIYAILKRIKRFENWEVNEALLAALLNGVGDPDGTPEIELRIRYNDRNIFRSNSAAVGWRLIEEAFTLSDADLSASRSRQVFLATVLRMDYSRIDRFLNKLASESVDWGSDEYKKRVLGLLVILADCPTDVVINVALRIFPEFEGFLSLMLRNS
jgi:CheY-like chemotaxis protein